jgi:hypothetical protein
LIRLKIDVQDNLPFFNSLIETVGKGLIELMQGDLRRKDAIATGYLYKSFRVKAEGLEGMVINEAPYSAVLEFGCSPHTPPYDAILKWVMVKKGEVGEEAERAAWRVLKKIEREGYEGRFYARDSLRELVRRGHSNL